MYVFFKEQLTAGSGTHRAFYPMGTEIKCQVPRLRMLGPTSPLPQYVLMAWCLV